MNNKNNKNRLVFIDGLRAFAILMMLQGHFISGVLAPEYRDKTNIIYNFWIYCRGFTAPIFFTITGWVFTFLLLKNKKKKYWNNSRIKKGLKRVIELLLWGYIIRLNLKSFYYGNINASFIQTDVLQIIAIGLFYIILTYFIFHKWRWGFFFALISIGIFIFITEPLYYNLSFSSLPKFIAAYLTKANNGVFYLLPWLGYVSIGAGLSIIFDYIHYKKRGLKIAAFVFLFTGLLLLFFSSPFFIFLNTYIPGDIFLKVAYNNFLFIRLGDVFILFALFIIISPLLRGKLWQNIGKKTLTIYIIHYFILYGSLTGEGFYKYYKYSFNWSESIFGALIFLFICVALSFILPQIFQMFKKHFFKLIRKNHT